MGPSSSVPLLSSLSLSSPSAAHLLLAAAACAADTVLSRAASVPAHSDASDLAGLATAGLRADGCGGVVLGVDWVEVGVLQLMLTELSVRRKMVAVTELAPLCVLPRLLTLVPLAVVCCCSAATATTGLADVKGPAATSST